MNNHTNRLSLGRPFPATRSRPATAEPERPATYLATPLVVVALGPGSAAAAEAFLRDWAVLPEKARRPVGVALLEGVTTFEKAWEALQPALERCLDLLPLDTGRRIGTTWEVVLVAGSDLRTAAIQGLLSGWAARSSWPLRLTVLVDAADLCPPWSAAGPGPAWSWDTVSEELAQLGAWVERSGLGWNGAYFTGLGNRFGFLPRQGPRDLYLARLLTVFATSDLADWLPALPTFAGDGAWCGAGPVLPRFSAIGLSCLWQPSPPWREIAVKVQARRLAHSHATARRLGQPLLFNRWLSLNLDHGQHLVRTQNRLLGQLLAFLTPATQDRAARCQELAAKVAERETRCLVPARAVIDQMGQGLLVELDARVNALGQDLVLGGGSEAFAVTLAGLDSCLALLRRTAAAHQQDVQELLRGDHRVLRERLLSPHGPAGLRHGRSRFFWRRWWRAWGRSRWLRHTSLTLLRVLQGEVSADLDAMLLRWCAEAETRLRRWQAAVRRFQADLHLAGRELLNEARAAVRPPVRTDVAAIPFPAFERWTEDVFGPLADTPAASLADAVPAGETVVAWHDWDRPRVREALCTLSEREAGGHRGVLEAVRDLRPRLPTPTHVTALARLSQPLVSVTAAGYDANPNHVFQRWYLPHDLQASWETSLPDGTESSPGVVPWPVVVTVYRDLPLSAIGDGGRV